MRIIIFLILLSSLFTSCSREADYNLIIRNGNIYDGKGGAPFRGDIGIKDDSIAFIGDLTNASGDTVIDAGGMAVAPGFINMLSWANESLIEDGRSIGDLKQGITLEVMGEGESMGPLNDVLRKMAVEGQGTIKYNVSWNTLGEYLDHLEKKGVSCNVASFVGATTVRAMVVGEENRDPTSDELNEMRRLVREAMEEGAMGVGSSLIYPPAFFAKTTELIALCEESARYNGMYISHMRSEGNKLLEAVDELITIARASGIRAEIYHLKAAGRSNWSKMDSVISKIENARKNGLAITADMYTYTAGATGMTASLPPSLQDGGFGNLWKKLQDPSIRKQMSRAMQSNQQDWENLYHAAGGAEHVILLGFRQDSLKQYIGKTLAEVAKLKNKSPEETAMDLIVHDSSRVDVAYYMMSEENIKKQIALPWVSFGSDAGSYSTEGLFLKFNPHPRAYGNFSRLLGKYVRDEKIIPLEEAIRRLTSLPAANLKLTRRGSLSVGNYADIVIFNSLTIADHSTFEKPHQYASGVLHVLVNGTPVLLNGNHTGARPGRFVKGPGFNK